MGCEEMSAYGNDKSLFEEATERLKKEREMKSALIQDLMYKDFIDDDGYPSESALTIIELWDFEDKKGWFDFIHGLWHMSSWGWNEDAADPEYDNGKEVYVYEISTGGWSGNESLIRAMEKNWGLWCTTWVQSRRGGHYIFEIGI